MDVYEELAEFYDLIYSDRYDLEFYLSEAKKADGPVLEVGCGTGRIYLELLKANIDITGIDLSKKMLERLAKKADALGLKPQVFEGDMRSFDLGRKFRLIFLPYRSFLHMLTDADRILALKNFKKHLSANGKLILHTYNPSRYELGLTKGFHHLEGESLKAPDGSKYDLDWYLEYDKGKKIAHYRIEITPESGQKHSFTMDISHITQFRMKKLLKESGFGEIREYGGFDYGLMNKNCKELICIAK